MSSFCTIHIFLVLYSIQMRSEIVCIYVAYIGQFIYTLNMKIPLSGRFFNAFKPVIVSIIIFVMLNHSSP
jgi:hypothetical protein